MTKTIENKVIFRLSKSVIGNVEKRAVNRILSNGFLGTGPETEAFESEISKYLGDCKVVCTNTGTSALQLALQAVGVGFGDEVLVPTLTYLASFQAVSATGAVPVPCDVKYSNALLDLGDAEKRITAKTKAIMPVHYSGYMGELDDYYIFASKNKLRVIEDAAHAFGSTYKGRKIGSFGDIICFSFDGIKNITSGEGGAIVSKDSAVINKVQDLRLLGVERDSEKRYKRTRSWEFDVKVQGWRYHMSDIMASIGRVQLSRLDVDFKPKRIILHKKYRELLNNIDDIRFFKTDIENVIPHIMPILVLNGKRDFVKMNLSERGIQTGLHYKPNHLLSMYGGGKMKIPTAEKIYGEILTLPLHPGIEVNEIKYICDTIIAIIKNDNYIN
jgi:dTDP-4-amino-4,6-dideoxygalactose transaminase